MRSWWEWAAARFGPARGSSGWEALRVDRTSCLPWLLIGKGPTFSHRNELDLKGFRTFGLNHVVRALPVDVAHAIDIEVLEQVSAEVWLQNAGVLVLPWRPHRNCRPAEQTLADHVRDRPLLAELEAQGRLLWYHLSTGRHFGEDPPGPRVPVKFFSAEAALCLLAGAGVRTVRTLGIDGGGRYAAEFADLEPLTNGRSSFDEQTAELARIVRRYGLDYAACFRCPPEVC